MARIKNDTLSGTLGNVTLSSRFGKPYIKSRPAKVYDPKTPTQLKQRGKFKAATEFVSQNLHQLIRPYWNPEARRQQMTGQNLFNKLNIHAFDENGNPDLEQLKPVIGNLGGFENLELSFLSDDTIEISWTNNSRDKKTNASNQLKVFGIDQLYITTEILCNARRKDECCTLQANLIGLTRLFLFFWNDKLEICSKHEWGRVER
ncbi:DUF6266 family protein [Bacteroidota bacterium]